MVTFNCSKSVPYDKCTWSVTASGDVSDYLNTMRAMLRILAAQHQDFMSREDNYTVLTLLEAMLPEPEQLKC